MKRLFKDNENRIKIKKISLKYTVLFIVCVFIQYFQWASHSFQTGIVLHYYGMLKEKKNEKKEWKKYRRQIIFGAGNPSARHVILMFWFSRTATDDGVLSISKIFGGTAMTNAFHYKESNMSINGIHSNDLYRTIIHKGKKIQMRKIRRKHKLSHQNTSIQSTLVLKKVR